MKDEREDSIFYMELYEHKAQYYETDQMGIIHHSNYIRWMEEARVDIMNQMGWGMDRIESMGMISPVLEVNCKYLKMVHFNESVIIKVYLKEYGRIKFTLGYDMMNKVTGEVCVTGESKHCFLHTDGKPVALSKDLPQFLEEMKKLLIQDV